MQNRVRPANVVRMRGLVNETFGQSWPAEFNPGIDFARVLQDCWTSWSPCSTGGRSPNIKSPIDPGGVAPVLSPMSLWAAEVYWVIEP